MKYILQCASFLCLLITVLFVYIMCVTDCWLDLNFVVDSSGSINKHDKTNWRKSLAFVADVVREFTIGPNDVQVAFVLFSLEATVEWGFTEYHDKDSLIDAILGVRYLNSWTNLNDALFLTRTKVYAPGNGAREGALRVTIILTDGEDNIPEVGTPWTLENATLCKNDSILLIAVGVTDGVDGERLKQISSTNDYYSVDDFDALDDIVDDLKAQICPTGPPAPGRSYCIHLIYSIVIMSGRRDCPVLHYSKSC